MKKDCRYRIYKEKQNKNSSNKQSNSSENWKNAFISYALLGNSDSNCKSWFLDSGASEHMTPHKELFESYQTCNKLIKIGDGSFLNAVGVGNVNVTTVVNDKHIDNVFTNVLHVPNLKMNLFSVSQALNKGFTLIGERDTCKLIKNDSVFAEAKLNDKVYILKTVDNHEVAAVTSLSKRNSLFDWHQKLAHQNIEYVKEILYKFNIDYDKSEIFSCDACNLGKSHRLPFKLSSTRSQHPCELIHMDLCGPMEVESFGGSKYFLLLKDDYSHFRFCYMLAQKSEVADIIKKFVALAEKETCSEIKCFRTDQGSEFLNMNIQQFLEEKGIRHQKSAPYCPEQNGRIEREMRTVVEAARSMLQAAGLDKRYWAEATNTAVYTLNLSGKSSIKNKTPYELWYGMEPKVDHLKIFGNKVFVHIPDVKRKKWDPKSKEGIFVGYEVNSKAYRICYPEEKKIIISRNVTFVTEKINVEVENNQQETYLQNDYSEEVTSIENEIDIEVPEEENEVIDLTDENEDLGKGKRLKKIPEKFKDYVLLTFQEAVNGEDSYLWKEAIKEEKQALKENETWKIVDKKDIRNKKILSSRWVFKIKDDGRYRARLVVRGCFQEAGIDYDEIFSPVIGSDALRIMLAYAAKNNFHLMKFDVKTAFLYGTVNEDLYMQLPDGLGEESNKICKLQKALYGLKQAPARWNERLKNCLCNLGLFQLKTEQCIFTNKDRSIYLGIHVDDGILAGSSSKEMKNVLKILQEEFNITHEENISTYLGINFQNTSSHLKLSQENYANEVVYKYRMSDSKPTNTPLIVGENYTKDEESVQFPFREAVGSLLYLSTKTRPDLAFAVNISGRKVEKPTKLDLNNLKRTLKYVNTTKNLGVAYSRNNNKPEKLIGYCDADFAGDKETRKSTTGFIVFYNNGPVSWASRRQPIVATSSTEAEYISAAEATKTLSYLKNLLEEITDKQVEAELNIDNQSAISLIKNGVVNRRSKHIDVRFHYIKEKVDEGSIVIKYCPSEKQIADILTKPLNVAKYTKLRNEMVL